MVEGFSYRCGKRAGAHSAADLISVVIAEPATKLVTA
jgi:hypothetical protein